MNVSRPFLLPLRWDVLTQRQEFHAQGKCDTAVSVVLRSLVTFEA